MPTLEDLVTLIEVAELSQREIARRSIASLRTITHWIANPTSKARPYIVKDVWNVCLKMIDERSPDIINKKLKAAGVDFDLLAELRGLSE